MFNLLTIKIVHTAIFSVYTTNNAYTHYHIYVLFIVESVESSVEYTDIYMAKVKQQQAINIKKKLRKKNLS